ncbi:MAG TPA: energy transducer TonB [Noviherbaspirillum sp.]|nr:energy transducer TonB [Noviherbaspirillum sp.]
MPPIDSAPRESAISAPAAPEPPAAQVAQAAAPEESAVVTAPQFDVSYLNNPKPTYPALSRRMGEQGKVVLRVSVSVEGLPTDVRLEASSGFPRLDDAAIRAVRNWRFTPARQGNKPVSASVLVPVRFQQDG